MHHSSTSETRRSKAKSDRRSQLIAAAEKMMAQHGFLAVRLEDIGAAAGVTGPAIYRHFPNKEAFLVELLVGVSARLLAGATDVVASIEEPADALEGLIDFHLDFAFGEPDLIRIQDRDLTHLPPPAQRQVRRAQRQYIEIWVDVLRRSYAALDEADARLMAQATFGLLNSTSHSVKPGTTQVTSRAVLRAMTVAAIATGGSKPEPR